METVQIGNLRWVVTPEDIADNPEECVAPASQSRKKGLRRKRASQANLILARANLHKIENVRVIGRGGLVDQAIESNGWRVMPPSLYKGIIPREAWETAEALTKGIPIKGFLIADDRRSVESSRQSIAARIPKINPDWRKIVTITGRVAGAIALAGAVVSFLPLLLGIGAIGVALAYDPLLIAVTADDEWICLYEWWE
jgi:hypothetical protein